MGKKKNKTGLRNMVHAMSLNSHYGTGIIASDKDKENKRDGRQAEKIKKEMKEYED